MTQAELAERAGVAELTVRRWETEGLRPQPAHVRSLCSALDVTPAELGYGTDDPAPTEPALDTPLDEPPRLFVLDARTLLAALSAARSAQPSAWLSATLDPIEEGVAATRLALMPGSTLEAGPSPEEDVGPTSYTGTQKSSLSAGFRVQEARGNVLMGVADESARFLRDTEASRIGSLTLDQLEADLRWLAHAYLNQPLAELFFPTVQLRNVIFTLLERNRYPEQTRQLYLICGQACLLLAKASKDFGSLAAAETQARTAWLCAELADNHDLRAWVRGYQALSAYWDGRPADAVRFVEGGQRFPARGTVALLLPSLHARAAGLMSDTRAITAALVAGDMAGEQTQPDDLAGGIFLFPAAEQALYASDAYTALGDGTQAEHHARRAIAQYEAVPTDDLFLDNLHEAQCNLATAFLDQDQVEGAAEALRPVLTTPPQHRSLPVTAGLRIFDRRLLAHSTAGSTPLASQLHDEITEFCAHPLTPQLPTA